MQFNRYTFKNEDERLNAVEAVLMYFGLNDFELEWLETKGEHIETIGDKDKYRIAKFCIDRAMAVFNAEVCKSGQSDEPQYIDTDTVFSVIIPMAIGYMQERENTLKPTVTSLTEGNNSIAYATQTYSTNIKDYERYLSRYKRLRTVGGW